MVCTDDRVRAGSGVAATGEETSLPEPQEEEITEDQPFVPFGLDGEAGIWDLPVVCEKAEEGDEEEEEDEFDYFDDDEDEDDDLDEEDEFEEEEFDDEEEEDEEEDDEDF
jgi:hypothetical protein